MAVTIPTLKELYDGILSDLEQELTITFPLFGKIFARALAASQAGKLKIYYLTLSRVQKNIFIDTADPSSMGGTLDRFGFVKLGRNRFSAVPGVYNVTVTGTSGTTIAAQTTFKSNDDSLNPGVLFILDANFTLSGSSDTISLRSLVGGLDGKVSISDQLTSTAPIANVDSLVTVASQTTEPLAAETVEKYRKAGLEAYQLEPSGGSPSDYRIWSSDAQGQKTVYPYAVSGSANEINVYVESVIASSTDGKGTPSQALMDLVADVIEFDPDTTKPLNERGRRPLGVFKVNILPVSVKEIDVVINNYVGITNEIKTIISTALTNAIAVYRPFVAGADVLRDRADVITDFNLSFVIQQAVPGARFSSINLSISGNQFSSFQFLNGDIPSLNVVSYD